MKERLEGLLGTQAHELWVQTFHAFGARFLRREAARAGLPPSFAIYDDDDQLRLVKRIFQELRVEDGEPLTARQALSRIDRWKNAAQRPAEVVVGEYDVEGQLAREVYGRFEAALARAGAVDFGDLLLRPVRLLEEDAQVRRSWSSRFRYLLVDEFQDTNAAQYRLLSLLTNEKRNVCVVGDDDQAIYSWRGADVRNILEFDRDFPGTRVVKLEQNYRSTRTVLDAAHAVISRARRRREKRLWTESGAGESLALLVGQDEHDEAERIARAIATERARGTAGEEIAVLYRTNAQSRPIEAALRAARVPYVIVRGTSFYERAEVKDAAAYLRLALSPRSDLDLERVVNRPARGIGEKTVERLRAHAVGAGGRALRRARGARRGAGSQARRAPRARRVPRARRRARRGRAGARRRDRGAGGAEALGPARAARGGAHRRGGRAGGEPRRARRRRARVRRVAPRRAAAARSGRGPAAAARALPRADRAPRRGGRRDAGGARLAHDAARGEGARVRGGVPRRPRGRDAALRASLVRRGRGGARGGRGRGAAPLLRRHDPREEAAHALARAPPHRLRGGRPVLPVDGAVALPRQSPARAVRPRPQARRRVPPRAGRPSAGRPARSRASRTSRSRTTARASRRRAAPRPRAPGRSSTTPSISAPRRRARSRAARASCTPRSARGRSSPARAPARARR